MSCDKCEDVHVAQREGKTQEPCKCSCHDNWTETGHIVWDNYTGTVTTTTGTNNITLGTDGTFNLTTSINIDEAYNKE